MNAVLVMEELLLAFLLGKMTYIEDHSHELIKLIGVSVVR